MTCSTSAPSSPGAHPLAALPFDPAWAAKEAGMCRARLFARGLRVPYVTDDEVASLATLLWWRVCCGELGGFRAKTDKPLPAQVQAYVAACLDHEVMRYVQQEGNPSCVSLPKGRQDVMLRVDPTDEEVLLEEALVDKHDPLAVLLAREQAAQVHTDLPEWPGPVGDLITPWWHQARDMDPTMARQCKARLGTAPSGGPDRVNWAWVLVQAAYRVDAPRTHHLAPMLCARWINANAQSPKVLLTKTYPRLGDGATVADIARQEMRSVLRMLAVEKLGDYTVSPQHVKQVSDDAAAAMTRWVGARGPYKKQAKAQSPARVAA